MICVKIERLLSTNLSKSFMNIRDKANSDFLKAFQCRIAVAYFLQYKTIAVRLHLNNIWLITFATNAP